MKSVIAPVVCVPSSSMVSCVTIVLAVLMWSAVPTEAQDISPNCTAAVARCFQIPLGSDHCRAFTIWMMCVSNKRNVCPVQQPKTTFQQISVVLHDVCQEVTSILSNFNTPRNGHCGQRLSECIAQSSANRTVGLTDPNRDTQQLQSVRVQHIINTNYWCRHNQENANCFVDNAGVCSVPDDSVRAIKEQLNKVKNVCQPHGAGCPSLVHSVSLLAVCVAVALFRG